MTQKYQYLEVHGISVLLGLTLLLGSCGGPAHFRDVEVGKVPLKTEEVEAIKSLLADAGVPSDELVVYQEYDEHSSDFKKDKILVQEEHVTRLRIRGTKLAHLNALPALTGLRDLDLSSNQISDLKGLKHAEKLEILSLFDNKVRSASGIEGCGKLKTLDLSKNQLSSVPDLTKTPYLERLDIGNNRLKDLASFRGGDRLRHLSFSNNEITSIKGLPSLPMLTYLSLFNNRIVDLQGLPEMPRLERLDLGHNSLESVEELDKCASLKWVDLSHNEIDYPPKLNIKLAELKLDGNPVAAMLSRPPELRIVKSYDAQKVEALPDLGGSLYGGSALRYKYTRSGVQAIKIRPSSFRFTRKGISLSGVSGFDIVPIRLRIKSARVAIYVKEGRVRIYLKEPEHVKIVKGKHGDELKYIPNDRFIHATASPDKPVALEGDLISNKYCKYQVVLEAVDGRASDVAFVITNY